MTKMSMFVSPDKTPSKLFLEGICPYDFALDGHTLYACGVYRPYAEVFPVMLKIDLPSWEVVYTYLHGVPYDNSIFYGVTFDAARIYLCGRTLGPEIDPEEPPTDSAFVVCLNKNTFVPIWVADSLGWFQTPEQYASQMCQDEEYIYVVGVPGGGWGFRRKIDKATGYIGHWPNPHFPVDYYSGIADNGSVVDVTGGVYQGRLIDRVDKSTNQHTRIIRPPTYSRYYKIIPYEGAYYIGGTGEYTLLIDKVNISDLSLNWGWIYDYSPLHAHEAIRGITVNSHGVYGLGIAEPTPEGVKRMVLVRLTHNGDLQWIIQHEDPNTSCHWAIVTYGDSLLVGTFNTTDPYYFYGHIERRSLVTGALV